MSATIITLLNQWLFFLCIKITSLFFTEFSVSPLLLIFVFFFNAFALVFPVGSVDVCGTSHCVVSEPDNFNYLIITWIRIPSKTRGRNRTHRIPFVPYLNKTFWSHDENVKRKKKTVLSRILDNPPRL